MNVHSGAKPHGHSRGGHHSRSPFPLLPAIPRDYIERRRVLRNISNVVMIVVLSLLIAGLILYNSNPGAFSR